MPQILMSAYAGETSVNVPVLLANAPGEASTEDELTAALADSSIDKITLMGDIGISSTLEVRRTVTLDLNGHVLKMTGSGSGIKVAGGGVLTITDSNKTAPHHFDATNDLWRLDEANGLETVYGGIITGGTGTNTTVGMEGGGVFVEAKGKLIMKGGNIVGCTADRDGGVCTSFYGGNQQEVGIFIMEGGSIRGCTATADGGGVAVNSSGGGGEASFTMKGGCIEACVAFHNGGGVAVINLSKFIMEGGKIIGCRAKDPSRVRAGGGVYSGAETTFEMSGGEISDCTADEGGGVYSAGDEFTMSGNAEIRGTVATGRQMNTDGDVTIGLTVTGTGTGETEFKGKVTNNGTIENGKFTGEVIHEYNGWIKSGTFKEEVENKDG